MNRAVLKEVPIGDVVVKACTWNPARDAADDEISYIDLSAIENVTKVVSGFQSLAGRDAPSRARQLVQAGDILVSTVRPNLNGVARVPDELDGGTASTGFCVLRPRSEKVDSSFLFHWVQSSNFVDDMVRKATGASYPAVSDKIIFQSAIPLPPLGEQKRIAAILDQADELRRKRKRAIDCLSLLGQAIFHEMFGNDHKVQRTSLKSLGKVSTGSTPPTSDKGSFGGLIPFVTPGDLGSGETVKRSLSEAGAKKSRTVGARATFVCCIGATIGKMDQATQRSAFNQQINAVEWGELIEPTYGFFAVQQIRPIIIHKGKGASTTLPILKKSEFEKLEIPCPPLALQIGFAERIAAVRNGSGVFLQSLDRFNVLFDSLQHRAFRGEL